MREDMLQGPEMAHLGATLKGKTSYIDQYEMSCNFSCCKYSEDEAICFGDYNYTDLHNLTYTPSWELGVRWTFAILVMLIAVLSNLCIIIILIKNRLLLRTSVNQFILNVSVADLILAVAGPIPFTIRDTCDFWLLGRAWCHLEGYIQMLVMLVSVTSLATISCDRMVGVVYPFHQHFKRWQSVCVIVIIWAASAILATPWAIYRIYTVHTWKDLTQTICGENRNIHTWWIVGVAVLTWLPLIIMVVSYTTILVYFHHGRFRNVSRMEHPVITHLKKRVVKMMFVLVIIFTLCWLPLQLLKITLGSFLVGHGQFKDDATEARYNCFLTVAQYIVYIHPAVNPFVYAFMHQTFRRAFRVTFPYFYTRKSSLVLTPGQGMRGYAWSVRSITTTSNDSVISRCPRGRVDDQRGGPPAALPSSAAKGVSMALDPDSKTSTSEEGSSVASHQTPDSNKYKRKYLSAGPEHNIARKSRKKKEMSFSLSSERSIDSDAEKKSEISSSVCYDCGASRDYGRIRSIHASPSLVNEGYVWDLPPRKMFIASTCTVSNLVLQVIEEESSSDIENEHVL